MQGNNRVDFHDTQSVCEKCSWCCYKHATSEPLEFEYDANASLLFWILMVSCVGAFCSWLRYLIVFPADLSEQITDGEVGRGEEIQSTLDYVHRQLGQLHVIASLPNSDVPSEALVNSALDVKSAVMTYVAVHLSHQCNRLGIGGNFQRNTSIWSQGKLPQLCFEETMS